MKRRLGFAIAPATMVLALGSLLVCAPALAYCPCYTLSSSANSYNCGIEAVSGTNPSIAEWQQIFDTVAKGPTVWGTQGPNLGPLGQGCGKPEPLHDVPAVFPCEILEAIAMAESGWTQFCVPDTPADQVGGPSRTIISFDCGYGVSQVTSGMHKGETPSFDPKRVAAEPLYNMATGATILAGKWKATHCVGDNQPSLIEHWYTAVWAYNGLSYKNNPNNPSYSSSRGVYDPAIGGAAPYQEKVFGRIEHPSGSPPYWPSVALAYPDLADVGGAAAPPDLPEPSCASPTDCNNKRSVHPSTCFSGSGGSGGAGGTSGAGGTGTGAEPGTGGTGQAGAPTTGGVAGNAGVAGSANVAGTGAFAGSAGSQQTGNARASDDDLAGGCGCRLRSGSQPSPAWLLTLLAPLAALRRKRR